ncbi:MAG: transglycosylase SLT domain-containing protein [Pseudonocardia sp.]|nr:transglycosylase SLT domain-containing protein [Pseudonocardia sp.]
MNAARSEAARRWSEAAALLKAAGRSPIDLLDWLGPTWSGEAAHAFDEWAKSFEQATHQAAEALEHLAALAHSHGTTGHAATGHEVLATGLGPADEAAVAIRAVPVPGQRVAAPPESAAEHASEQPTKQPGPPPKAAEPSAASSPPPKPATSVSPATSTTSPGPGSPGSVQAWIEQAMRILREHGYRPEQIDPAAIAVIIRHESSGNPAAVNNWDSNAARGTPSMGLMQTIGPTFDRWHLPGHDKILDPVDNIIAGVRYAVHRYGSVSRVPGVLSMAAGGGYQGY